MFWKKGTEYRGVAPMGGERTRWEVARARPRVTNSSAVGGHMNTYALHRHGGGRERHLPLPILTTKVPGMGGTSIHSPERFWTWRPGWGDAWRSFRDDQACDTACIDRRAAYEREEASIVVRTDTLTCGRPIVGRVLDDLEACLCMRISFLRCDLTFARCCINSSAS